VRGAHDEAASPDDLVALAHAGEAGGRLHADALMRHIRAGWVEGLMTNLWVVLMAHQTDPEVYCSAPGVNFM
jgi:hypothetical protein